MFPGHWRGRRSSTGQFSIPPTARQRSATNLCLIKANVMWTRTLDERAKGMFLWYVRAALVNFLWTRERRTFTRTHRGMIYGIHQIQFVLCTGAVGLHWSEQSWTTAGLDRSDLRPDLARLAREGLCAFGCEHYLMHWGWRLLWMNLKLVCEVYATFT